MNIQQQREFYLADRENYYEKAWERFINEGAKKMKKLMKRRNRALLCAGVGTGKTFFAKDVEGRLVKYREVKPRYVKQ